MSNRAVLWNQIEAQATASKAGLIWEKSMSNLKYAIVEVEEEVVAAAQSRRPKPFVVTPGTQTADRALTRRVEAALDVDFANGSMPA